jgi:hypothetical protein
MASEVDICNLALSHIGDKAEITSISPPGGSAQAAQCKKFYPIARDECLSDHNWGFAKRRQLLARISGTAPSGWEYWYTIPNPYLVARQVVVELSDTPIKFEIEGHDTHGTIVLAESDVAELWYTTKVEDPSKYPAKFVHALSWLLASYLALPLTREAGIKKATYEQYLYTLGGAASLDANAGKQGKAGLNLKTFEPSGIKARR